MPRRPRPCALAIAAALASALLRVAPSLAQEAPGGSVAPVGARLEVSRSDLVLSPYGPPLAGAAKFRFSAGGAWIRCDRDLVLSAAPGEERRYRLELEDGDGSRRVLEYLIDKRRPAPPSALPDGGLFDADLSPALAAEEGAALRWAIFGPEGGAPAFAALAELSSPLLPAPSSGTATFTLVAYAEDEAGNRSSPSRFVYRLAEKGLAAEPPLPAAAPAPLAADPGLAAPRLERLDGSVQLSFAVGPGASALVAVGLAGAPERESDFTALEASDGIAHLALSCPYGWSGELRVWHGLSAGGKVRYSPSPLVVALDHPVAAPTPPPVPAAPQLVSDASGRGSFVLFPSCEDELFVSLDGSEPSSYRGPMLVGPSSGSVSVTWYGEDEAGLRSAVGSARFALPPGVPRVALVGVEEGQLSGTALRLEPSIKAVLRYELRSGKKGEAAQVPPEPVASSPLIGEGLEVDCPAGEDRWFAIRYRPFASEAADSPAGESGIVRFEIDRSPPEAPRLLSAPTTPYLDRPVSIAFAEGEPGSILLASVSADGSEAPFRPLEGELRLPGSDEGPVSYNVRAYRVDAAGNRSAEMRPLALVVDRSSVYAASDAREGGDGSPARPYRNLDAAIAAAIAGGKRSLFLRGSFESAKAARISGRLEIAGGYGPGWERDPTRKARILAVAPTGTLRLEGGELSLRSLELSFPDAGGSPLFEVSGGSLTLADCSVAASSAGELLAASAAKGRIRLERSSMIVERAQSCALFRMDDSDLAIVDSMISAGSGVRVFALVDAVGGAVTMTGSLAESSADLALNLLTLRRSRVLLDRCLLRADSGAGYLRIGTFDSVEGELRNSRVIVSWAGEGLLFETAGACPAFRHLTVMAATSRGALGCFSSSRAVPEIWNSIFSFEGGGTLLRSDVAPRAGSLVADCVWGFERLVDGPVRIDALADLDALNASSAAYASRKHVSEPPERTFSAPVKSLSPLSRGSACVDSAYPLDGEAYAGDFKRSPRPSAAGKRLPDIGADEFAE